MVYHQHIIVMKQELNSQIFLKAKVQQLERLYWIGKIVTKPRDKEPTKGDTVRHVNPVHM